MDIITTIPLWTTDCGCIAVGAIMLSVRKKNADTPTKRCRQPFMRWLQLSFSHAHAPNNHIGSRMWLVAFVALSMITASATQGIAYQDPPAITTPSAEAPTTENEDGEVVECAETSEGTEDTACVEPPPPPPTAEIYASDDHETILGFPITISWVTTNTSYQEIVPQFGPVSPVGAKSTIPLESQTYTITAIGLDGIMTATASVDVIVWPEPPVLTLVEASVTGSTVSATIDVSAGPVVQLAVTANGARMNDPDPGSIWLLSTTWHPTPGGVRTEIVELPTSSVTATGPACVVITAILFYRIAYSLKLVSAKVNDPRLELCLAANELPIWH